MPYLIRPGTTSYGKHSVNKVIKLINALKAWGSSEFEKALKDEIQAMDAASLPRSRDLRKAAMSAMKR